MIKDITVWVLFLVYWVSVWKKRECWEFILSLLLVRNGRDIKESRCMALKRTGVQKSGLVVISYKWTAGLNDEKAVFLSRNVKAYVIKLSDNQRRQHHRTHRKAQM